MSLAFWLMPAALVAIAAFNGSRSLVLLSSISAVFFAIAMVFVPTLFAISSTSFSRSLISVGGATYQSDLAPSMPLELASTTSTRSLMLGRCQIFPVYFRQRPFAGRQCLKSRSGWPLLGF